MKKRILSLMLALTLCVGLAVSAFAAPVDAPGPNAIDSEGSPRYAVYEKYYPLYIGASSYDEFCPQGGIVS